MALAQDPHLHIIPLVFETPHSYVMSYDLERFDSGLVAGDLEMPEDREREVFHFQCISSDTPIYSQGYPNDGLRHTLGKFYAGGQMRVYRLYPANIVAWSEANEEGYSDVVQVDPTGAQWSWYAGMIVFNFSIDGVSV